MEPGGNAPVRVGMTIAEVDGSGIQPRDQTCSRTSWSRASGRIGMLVQTLAGDGLVDVVSIDRRDGVRGASPTMCSRAGRSATPR